MSEPWKRGDLALCINSDGWSLRGSKGKSPGPQCGEVNEVAAVWMHGFPEGDIEALQFPAWPGDSFASDNFVKVTPGADIEGSEIERERFKQGNPWKVPA